MGNAGAAIVGDLGSDRGVAVIDQHVGDWLGDPRPAGDIGQMRLALGLHDLDEILVAQAGRLLQDGTGNLDDVVARQRVDRTHRRVGNAPPATR
jgi:hypothetical protein